MTNKPDLTAFINTLLAEKPTKKPVATTTGSGSVTPLWQNEAIVYLVTTTNCDCGATSTQTNPHAFLRKYHARKQAVHEEALALAHNAPMLHSLPVSIETREIRIHNCHECLADPCENHPANQLELF